MKSSNALLNVNVKEQSLDLKPGVAEPAITGPSTIKTETSVGSANMRRPLTHARTLRQTATSFGSSKGSMADMKENVFKGQRHVRSRKTSINVSRGGSRPPLTAHKQAVNSVVETTA